MALTNVQFDTIMRKYEETQTINRHIHEERTAEIYEKVDGYRELCQSIASLSVEQGKKLLFGDENALNELKASIGEFKEKKKELLKKSGYPEDYLFPIYTCQDCKDTGYVDGIKCHCFKQAEIELLYNQSGIRDLLEKENFSKLSYNYWEGELLVHYKENVNKCLEFIHDFEQIHPNLLMYGPVGTGKSFLSGCIGKELLEKGYSVIYFSAAGLFEKMTNNKFDYNKKEEMKQFENDIYKCDLLIIDDLGTEFQNNFTASEFFAILNQRHLNQKSTIISTNLSLIDIVNRYSERVISRIKEWYIICKFIGPDIRMIKKIQSKNSG